MAAGSRRNWVRPGSSRLTTPRFKRSEPPLEASEAEPSMAQIGAGFGVLRRLALFRITHGLWKAVTDGALERVGCNGSGDFHIRLKKVQKEPVFTEPFPFRHAELRDELLVALILWHRKKRNAAGWKTSDCSC